MNQGSAADSFPSSQADPRLLEEFTRQTGLTVKEGVPGSRLSTFMIGGPLLLVDLQTTEELSTCLKWLTENRITYRALGAGSNLLISDSGLSDWVLRLGRGFRTSVIGSAGTLIAGGAMPLMTLSREQSERGLSGLEFAGGIPASLGGAIWMNAGAHGGETSEVLSEITFVTADGTVETINAREIQFRYRRSNFPEGSIVASAILSLTPSSKDQATLRLRECLAERKANQPLSFPSAGSIFKNPPSELSAGKLIEKLGLRGTEHGGASISKMHGNWIINHSRNALAADVQFLMSLCQRRVKEELGVELQPEVKYWG